MTNQKFTYENEIRERLDKFLQSKISDLSRHQLQKIILSGQVTVNGKLPTVHHWLKMGDKIALTVAKKSQNKNDELAVEPKIVDQTEEYIIIDKPSGLLVHATDRGETNTLVDWLKKHYPKIKSVGDDQRRPGIVHRLDKDASGLMVVALNQKSFDNIKKQFQNREVKKEYTALVHGHLLNDRGEISSRLERDKKTGLTKAQIVKDSGREAFTSYEVIEKFQNFSLLRVQIKTGRSHQIRAHLYSIGHSLVGDKLYQTKNIRKKKKTLDQRIFLHATFLQFKNLTGDKISFKVSLPLELKKFLKTLA